MVLLNPAMIALTVFLAILFVAESTTIDISENHRQVYGSCFLFGCPSGQCCSQYGYCGSTPEHCEEPSKQKDCRIHGCPDGLCCSKFGYCGNTPEHCDNTPLSDGNCKTQGCPPGQCCSIYGFCGITPAHCGNIDLTVGQGNCHQTGCAPGQCCSKFGFCGNSVQHCLDKSWWYIPSQCNDQTCVYGRCFESVCKCDPGITGNMCNMDIIDCDSDSCLNNSTCIELVNGFACQCLPGFYGSRCQYYRSTNDNNCKKICYNNGKCIITNNREKCLCSLPYYGVECENIRNNNSLLNPIRKCSLLKYRKYDREGTCLAISLTPLIDGLCNCKHDDENKQFMNCQLVSKYYTRQKCSFKKAITQPMSSTLPDPMAIHVCPVNWQILDQYENTQEIVNTVHMTRCQLAEY